MLFESSKCPKCKTLYDDLLVACPHCHSRNPKNLEFREKYQISWLPPMYELFLFLIGLIGLVVLSTVGTTLFKDVFKENELLGMTIVNSLTYILLLVVLILLVRKFIVHNLLCFFKQYKSYIYAVVLFIPLIVFSAVISMMVSTYYPSINVNQDLSEKMIRTYPFVSILVMGIIGPICEELAYRVGLFSFLRRINRILAYILCILIFSLAHIDFTNKDIVAELVALPSYIVGAFFLTFAYEKKGPACSMSLHILNNIFAIITILVSGA